MRSKVKHPGFRNFVRHYLLKVIIALIVIELLVIAFVQNRNQKPLAQVDNATVVAGGSVDIPVLVNDSDKDIEDKLIIETVSDPEHGEATLHNRVIRYTPDAGYVGEDQFSYTITDGKAASKPAEVTVSVKPSEPKS